MTNGPKANQMQERALIKFLLENRAMMNYMSILMLVYAVWATIEVITNASGAMWWPPETGIPAGDIFGDPDRTQNINNGWVIGSGAVFGTVGSMIQYFYRAAPYVDASMQATAALIISAVKEEQIQESAEKLAEEIVAEAEEAAEAEEEAAAKAAVKEVKAAAKEAKATAKKAKAAEAEMAEEAKESAVAEEDSEASTETEEAVEGGPKKKF
jgi:hypothetical protein|tara:strand:- start:30 stop:665 length:636 start_codon:yes stop_codon:yes gene_type:complete